MQSTARIDESVESAVPPTLIRAGSYPLPHSDRTGSPALIGIDAHGQVALEMIYGTDGWLAQYVIAADGTLVDQRDEAYGHNPDFEPLDLTDFSNLPPHLPDTVQDLAFAGGRWRGLRETDRVPDILQPLTVSEKMALNSYGFAGPVLGVVESRVLAAAQINDRWLLICRQVRIALAVPLNRDIDGLPYDYDSSLINVAQWVAGPAGTSVMPLDQPLDQVLAMSHTSFSPQPTDLLYDSIRQRLWLIDNPDEMANRESAPAAALHIFECP